MKVATFQKKKVRKLSNFFLYKDHYVYDPHESLFDFENSTNLQVFVKTYLLYINEDILNVNLTKKTN